MLNPIDVPTARANLDRAREALAAADLRHAEAQQLRRLHAGSTLADSDPEAMARFAKAADNAEAARRAVDDAALVVAEGERVLREAEAAAELDRRRAAAAGIHAKAESLLEVAGEIERVSADLNKLFMTALRLDLEIRTETKNGFGDYDFFHAGIHEHLKTSAREFASKISSVNKHGGVLGVTTAAERVIRRSAEQIGLLGKTELKDVL